MALIKCHECGKEVSTEAVACPNCGVKPNQDKGGVAPKPLSGAQWAGIIIIAIVAFLIFSSGSNHKAAGGVSAAPAIEEAPANEPIMQVTAKELALAYNKNSVSADVNFKNKRYEVTGIVSEINTDVMGNAVIGLKGGINEFLEPQFVLAENEKSRAGQVEKGQELTLICVGGGDVIKMPQSKDCVFK